MNEIKTETLNVAEAAAYLGIHPHTLRKWGDAGRIPCWTTLGGHRRFDRAAMDAVKAEAHRGHHPTNSPWTKRTNLKETQ